MSTAVESQLREVQVGLTGLAIASSLQKRDWVTFDQRARDFQKVMGTGPIVLLDETGRQVVNTRLPVGAELPNQGSDAPAISVIQTGQPTARLARSAITKAPILIVAIPVADNTGRRYSLGVRIDFDRFYQLLASAKLPPRWIASIIDSEGKIVARNVKAEAFVGKPITPKLKAVLENKSIDSGTYEGTTLEGISTLIVYSRTPISGWTVAIGIPRADLDGRLQIQLAVLAALTLILLSFAYYLAWRSGKRIANSVASLVNASVTLGRGEPVQMPKMYFEEANKVGAAMIDASKALHQADSDLVSAGIRWQAVLNTAMDGIVVVNALQKIVSFNIAASRMYGHEPETVIGMPLEMLVPPGARDGHIVKLEHYPGEPNPKPRLMGQGETLFGLRRDGSEFPIEVSMSSVVVEEQLLHTLIVRDITERLRTQEALLRSNIELKQFAFVASHDMRTPLRSIIGFLSIVAKTQASVLQPRSLELLNRASRAAEQLVRLTTDLLAYAQLERERRSEGPVPLDELLNTCRVLLTSEIEATNARVESGPLPTVNGSRPELIQLLQNLIGNAIKYRAADRDPLVSVTCEAHGTSGWHLTVTDNGIGIELDNQEQVFKIFQRLHLHEDIPGSGIGLAVCRKIAEHHGGRIWVESVVGTGSIFHVTLHETEQS